MSKKVTFGSTAREQMMAGMNLAVDTCKVTLGPSGRNVVLQQADGSAKITKDGVEVIKSIEPEEMNEYLGARMVADVSGKTADQAGDGTTTAAVLAQSILLEGLKAVVAGLNPLDIKAGIELGVQAMVKHLQEISKPISSSEEIAQVGTISANGDHTVGADIANAMEQVGADGIITVEESNELQTTINIVKGLQLEAGFVSPLFINNRATVQSELTNPYVLLVDGRIRGIRDLMPIMEQVHANNRPLFIIAEDVAEEITTNLLLNLSKNLLVSCLIKAPGMGIYRTNILKDVAVLTGATVVSEENQLKLVDVKLEQLGTAAQITTDREHALIINPNANKKAIEERIAAIRAEINTVHSPQEKEVLQRRIAKLVGGIGVIKVGGLTELEMKEKHMRVEDALYATRAAVEEGILPGGGVALLRARSALMDLMGANSDQDRGISILYRAVEAPLRQIVLNRGGMPDVVVNKVLEGGDDFGYNAATDTFGDMLKMGIIDPTKVTRCALQNAASIASLMLTTEAIVAYIPFKRTKTIGGDD